MSLMLHRAALFSPLPLIQPLAVGARMAVTGDSIMRANADASPTTFFSSEASLPDWANVYSGGCARFPQYANTAVNNTGTDAILARFEADIAPLDPDFVLMNGGTVNWEDGATAILADYDAIIAICASYGWYLIIMGPLPSGHPDRDLVSAEVRAGLAARASSMVRIVDVSGFDPVTMTTDTVHPHIIGAQFLGQRIAAGIAGLVQAGDPTLAHDDPLNLCTIGNMAGTGGTVTGASGVVADGWELIGTDKGGATVTGSKATLVDGTPAQQVVVSGNYSGTNRKFEFSTGFDAITGVAADEQLELSFQIEVEGGQNIYCVTGALILTDAGFASFPSSLELGKVGGAGGHDVQAFAGAFRVMPASLVGAAPAYALLGLSVTFRDAGSTTPVALTVRVGRVTLRKVPAAGPPWAMSAPSLAPGNTTISVDRAAAPYANGAAVSGYELRHSTDQASWTVVTMTTDPQSITSLTNGTPYYVQTRAINSAGNGPWSASASAAPVVGTAWDAAAKHADITLSETDMRATVGTGGSKNVRSTTSRSSGKLYIEFEIVAWSAAIGIGTSAVTSGMWLGQTNDSTGWDGTTGIVYRNNTNLGSAGIGTAVTGNIIGMAIDKTNNKVWFSRNGSFGSGHAPATNTGGFSIPSGALYAILAMYSAAWSVRIRPTAALQTYSPPSGFSAWDT